MALFKKAEFAAECGVSNAHISVAIKRGNIILTEDDQIDTGNATNSAYRERCRENAAKRTTPEKSSEKPLKIKKEGKPEKPARMTVDPEVKKRVTDKFNVEIKEKETRIAKMEREDQLLKMKQQKLSGQLIPTDLVINTIRQLTQSILVSFSDGADALIVDIAKATKMDRAKIADLRKRLKEISNQSINRSIDDAQKNITNITQEHSQNKAA